MEQNEPTPSAPAAGIPFSAALPYLLLTATQLFWAGNFVIGRALRDDISPVMLSFGRWLLALLILVPIAYTQLRVNWPALRANWRLVAVLGITGVAGFNTVVYTALTATTALNAVLFTATTPITIALLAWVWFRDTITVRQGVGIVLSLLGVAVVIVRGDIARLLELQFNPGDLLMLVAILLWTVYSVVLKRRPPTLQQLPLVTASVMVGVPVLLPVLLWEMSSGAAFFVPTIGTVLGLLYVAVFASVLAFIFWNMGVAAVGPNRAGIFLNLIPVFGAILSIVFLGEQIATYHLVSGLLVVVGIALTTRSRPQPQAAKNQTNS